ALCQRIGIDSAATTIVFNADPSEKAAMIDELLDARNVAVFEDKAGILQGYKDMMAPFRFLFIVFTVMAIFIGFAVIYNISKVSLSERSRELATMRVLGLSIAETNEVITFEHWMLYVLALICGLPISVVLRHIIAVSFNSDLFTLPTTIPPYAVMLSAIGSMVSVLLANRSVGRAIAQFDLVDVLKERE
ncbi:MAG: ABC transporter permease, partial [Symbiobacteriaceae bacterium]|nr:ABC transporter permease [Symbiobacteriaceae bacterium]